MYCSIKSPGGRPVAIDYIDIGFALLASAVTIHVAKTDTSQRIRALGKVAYRLIFVQGAEIKRAFQGLRA